MFGRAVGGWRGLGSLVAVVTTGGTIAEKADPRTEGVVPAVSALNKMARVRVTSVCNIDSSQMTPEIWAKVSRAVGKELADPEVPARWSPSTATRAAA